MSRIANSPIRIPENVEISISDSILYAKGEKGSLSLNIHDSVFVKKEDNQLYFLTKSSSKQALAHTGTTRSLVNNTIVGVCNGFERRLNLVGVGYRAQMQDRNLNLSLGFSHPVVYKLPEDITISVLNQTEIVVSGIDKQKVGQVAAIIRSYRPPEPYKGKGVRYADEQIVRKEAKKK